MSRRAILWLVFGGTVVLCALTMSYVAADYDGHKETWIAFDRTMRLRPFHLIHSPLNRAAFGLWHTLGWRGPAFVPLQYLNTVLGAVMAVQLWLLAVRCGVSPRVAGATCAVFVLSATPWLHCRTAETGMTPMPFAFGALLLLLPEVAAEAADARRRAVLAGLLMTVALLLSLNFVVLVPALCWAAWRLRRRASDLAALLAALMLANLVAYGIAVSIQGVRTPGEFWFWFFHHEDAKGLSGASKGLAVRVLRSGAGIGRLFFPVSWGETALKAVLRHQPVEVSWTDWLTFARNSLTMLLTLALTYGGWRALRDRPVGQVAAVAVVGITPFNIIWLGSDPQYWLPVMPFILALAAVALSHVAALGSGARRRVIGASALFGALLLQANLPGTTPSPLWPRWGPEWQRSRQAAATMATGGLVIVPGNTSLRVLDQLRHDLEYCDLIFTADQALEGQAFLDWLAAQIDAALEAGRAVYVEGLRAPLAPEYLGNWEMTTGTHRVRREEVETFLDRRYPVRAEPGLPRGVERVGR